jgi:hypothetical protein
VALDHDRRILEVHAAATVSPDVSQLARRIVGVRHVSPRVARLVQAPRPRRDLQAPAGLRSAAPATQQWLFEAGGLEIDVQAFPEDPEHVLLMGHVLGPQRATADLAVHLRHDGQALTTFTSTLGQFDLPGVAGRAVQVLLETDDDVHCLDLGPVPAEDEDDP